MTPGRLNRRSVEANRDEAEQNPNDNLTQVETSREDQTHGKQVTRT